MTARAVTLLLVLWALCAAAVATPLARSGQRRAPVQTPPPAPLTTPAHRPLPSAGAGEHGWFALPGQQRLNFPTLYHLPPNAEPGTVRGGPRLSEFPEALAAHGDRVVLVMPRERVENDADTLGAEGAGAAARLIRRVQTIRVARAAARGVWDYFPRGRDPVAMPSLPGRGELRGVAMTADALYALLQGAPDDAGTRRDVLLVLDEGAREWRERPLPAGWVVEQPGSIISLGGRLALLQRSTVWEVDQADGPWRRTHTVEPIAGAVVAAAGSSIILARATPERITLELLRDDVVVPLGAVEHAPEDFAVIGGSDLITVVWRGEGDATRLRAAVVSAISGDVLYDDVARTNAVVTGREIQSLALLVGALMLTILVFVLRPDDALAGAIVIPEGYALASPLRRVGAVLLDLLPPLAVCAAAFGVSGSELLHAAVLSDDATTRGALALGVAFMITGLHSVLGEWLFGRTLGKAVLRCRTLTTRGERPRLWQTGLRTLVKLLFPPFALFLFLDARRRHPGDLASGTVVVQRHTPPPGPEAGPDELEPPGAS